MAPGGLGRWFRCRGFITVTELNGWESVTLRPAGLEGAFVPAHRWSRRGLLDHCASLRGGWILAVSGGQRVYHAGDSAYDPFFAEVGPATR